MMPIIQPLPRRTEPLTEYEKEQQAFADLKLEFQKCNSGKRRTPSLARGPRFFRGFAALLSNDSD